MTGRIRRLIDRGVDRLHATLETRIQRRYERAPLCAAPMAPAAEYMRRWEDARRLEFPVVDRFEVECGAAIDGEWFHQLALVTQVPIKASSICYQHGRLLYAALVRYARAHRGPLTIVETGTARGFSSLCMAKALADSETTGKIITFDVLPHDVSFFWNCVRDEAGPRTRAALLQDYAAWLEPYVIFHRGDTKREMAKMSVPRVHFAFLDSVHTYDYVMAEFASIRDRQRPGDILFFDDYTVEAYPGVVKAADEICRMYAYAPTVIEASARRRYLIAEKMDTSSGVTRPPQ